MSITGTCITKLQFFFPCNSMNSYPKGLQICPVSRKIVDLHSPDVYIGSSLLLFLTPYLSYRCIFYCPLQVIGQHGVVFIDITRSITERYYRYFYIRGVYASYLTHGDGIYLNSMTFNFSSSKMRMTGSEKNENAYSSTKIVQDESSIVGRKSEFYRIASSLFDSPPWSFSSWWYGWIVTQVPLDDG